MGIPGFFSWLLQKYSQHKIIINNPNKRVDNLYIDANCLFHPQCMKLVETLSCDIDNETLEQLMIENIMNYITYIIKYVSPTLVYISVDGVAPLAKINQQRYRRYKSHKDSLIRENLLKKYKTQKKSSWSNVSITPGTQFMEKLHIGLKNYCAQYSKTNNVKIIYSSYHTPGEGEHKILDYLRTLDKGTHVIYGLDADLIFLAMTCQNKNMYLLRESETFKNKHDNEMSNATINNPADEFLYVCIDALKICFTEKINEIIYEKMYNYNLNISLPNDLTNDVVFICYFLGNDFIAHLPTIDIKKYGMDILLDAYAETYVKYQKLLVKFVDHRVTIDMVFLDNFINYLSIQEKQYFEEILPYWYSKMCHKRCYATNAQDKIIWELENMKIIKPDDVFQLNHGNMDDWKFKYYEYYFGSNEYQEELIQNLCSNYLEGLMWVTRYYFEGCAAWRWSYNYSHAPFLSDLSKFIRSCRYDINNVLFDKSIPLTPLVQLLSVIPPAHNKLLPIQFRELMMSSYSNIIDMFPTDIEYDIGNKDMFWQCLPMLPHLDIERITKETDKIVIGGDFLNRNINTNKTDNF